MLLSRFFGRGDISSTRRPMQRRPLVESLEGRQLLSTITLPTSPPIVSAIQRKHIGTSVADAIQGNHIGTNVSTIQGNHIGTSVVNAIQGNHIGTGIV